jgi:general secretion pathway protein K
MLVLWLVVVLGALTAAVAASGRGDANLVINLRTRVAARNAAESGVVAAAGRLESLLRSASTPADAARRFHDIDATLAALREVRLGGARFGVAVEDLNARIDLNLADDPTLLAFFSQFTDSRRASGLVASLADWRDQDDLVRPGGAEAAEYARAGSLFTPRNAPLQRLEELRHIRGMTDALAEAMAEDVTVDGDGRINLNTASARVLAALPFVGPAGGRALVARRDAGEVFTSPAVITDVLGARAAVPMSQIAVVPSRLLVVSRGWEAGHPLTHEIQAVYSVVGQRLTLVAWKERDR